MQKDTAAFVASKRKRKSPAKLNPVEATSEIPEDLKALWGAVKGFEKTHALLKAGRYDFDKFHDVHQSLLFIQAFYKETLANAGAHPKAAMIPELAELQTHLAEQSDGANQKEQ